jgi:hypothetical protein
VWFLSKTEGDTMARKAATATAEVIKIGGEAPTPGADDVYQAELPYRISVTIEGVADMLFHAWNVEAVEAKAKAAKGSAEKKTDNLESYVYRNERGELCVPGDYLRGAIVLAAKYQQDPRSPRKSAMDLFKAGVVNLTPLASLGKSKWDYEDKHRVIVQRSAVTRTRPAFRKGWKATFEILVMLPEYISPQTLNQTISTAGRLGGLGDFRPTYGRFVVTNFEVLPP